MVKRGRDIEKTERKDAINVVKYAIWSKNTLRINLAYLSNVYDYRVNEDLSKKKRN